MSTSSVYYKDIDFRKEPERYRVGRSEQGVLQAEPYKSELLPHWRFKSPEIAKRSAEKIHSMFEEYKAADDFVGMDMARWHTPLKIHFSCTHTCDMYMLHTAYLGPSTVNVKTAHQSIMHMLCTGIVGHECQICKRLHAACMSGSCSSANRTKHRLV